MNKFMLERLVSKKEKLIQKYTFYKTFLPISINEKEEKLNKKIEYLQKNKELTLKQYAINAGIKVDYLEAEKANKLQKLEEKYSLKNKALKQSKLRALKKQDETEVNKIFDEKIKTLLASKEAEKEKLNNYYAPSDHIDESLTVYKEKETEINTILEAKEKVLKDNYNQSVKKQTERVKNKVKDLEQKIENLTKQIDKAKSSIEDLTYGINDEVLLRLKDLTMRFGGLLAVDKLSFDVKKGEIFGLIGPNGAGKTTVFNCLTKFYNPTAGEMYYRKNELEVTKLNDYQVHNIVKLGIVRTFQNVELIWELSILDNLLVAAHTNYQTGFFGQLIHTRGLAREEKVYRNKALKILKDLNLLQYQYAYPLGLPYGILKRVELARTLMTNPRLIILDEPAAGLNDAETEELSKTIRKIRDEYNTTIFLVEHDMGLVMDVCDTVCAISFGKKLAIGTPKEIQANKLVREAYLGEE
ncbi:ATP-binding cassette domain-containing protein [Candidatus Izemoplasma sp. B36]|uniref:ABC transporter ATP-binding protein n=1 Tax=Candidatus Izemoplasma sp. B36 TaxID=3242468 RepID=UPI003557CC73